MVEELIEVKQIFHHINKGENFLLSGGAGSGKTYSLIRVVHGIYSINPLAEVACITYTNVAANEIKERAPFDRLKVSTIHDFFWGIISNYQKDLKLALADLISNSIISYSGEELLTLDYFANTEIQYREWKKLEKGIISHDEVIYLAEYLFSNNKLLCDILKDKFDYILVDEYQDTFKNVIDILLTHLKKSEKTNIVGFFGDSMQSIFSNGVGSIRPFVEKGLVKEVIKVDNRRNPASVIQLINKLRNDGLTQEPASDPLANNFGLKGSIKFIYSNSDNLKIDEIKKHAIFQEFDFDNNKENKELYLVHNLIANKAGFPNLISIYDKDGVLKFKDKIRKFIKENSVTVDPALTFGEVIEQVNQAPTKQMTDFINANPDLFNEAKGYRYEEFKNIFLDKDQLIGDKKTLETNKFNKGEKRDSLIKHLFNIQDCVFLYTSKRYNEFIKKTKYSIMSVESKQVLKDAIDRLQGMSECTIDEVIEFAHESRIWPKGDEFFEFVKNYPYVYNRVRKIKYKELVCIYNYVEGFTPYSTQHNIKGAEFDNVFVILDNGGWNNYNFEYLFSNMKGKESIIDKTQKIFYVCCSRAKKNLVVFFHKPSKSTIQGAEDWFGIENVISI